MIESDMQVVLAMLLYFVVVVVIGFVYAKRSNSSSEEYFLGGRGLGPWLTALSAEASDMSGWLLMGLPGVAYFTGASDAMWTAIGLAIGTYLNWLIVAKRLRHYSEVSRNSVTVPDFFENRFRDGSHLLMGISAVVIVIFFVPYTASGFADCGKLFSSLFGVNYMAAMIVSAVVIVATVKALKYNGGVAKADLGAENLEALERGLPNLLKHVENITRVFGLPCVVAINRFTQDTDAELELIRSKCAQLGVNVAMSEVWGKGGDGGIELAQEVLRLCEQPHEFHFAYELDKPIKEKIADIVTKIYGGSGVTYSKAAEQSIATLEKLGYGNLPICMAKTQYSLSDDASKLGRPEGFTISVSKVKVSAGAGFIVVQTGDIMTMPGLPKVPAAERIDIDENGKITGLF